MSIDDNAVVRVWDGSSGVIYGTLRQNRALRQATSHQYPQLLQSKDERYLMLRENFLRDEACTSIVRVYDLQPTRQPGLFS